jgi:hypothetical protein
MDPEEFERERALVGELDELDVISETATVPAGERSSGAQVAELLEAIQSQHPDARIWKGVREVRAVEGGAVVQFHEGLEPRHLSDGGVEVECHLYDEEARRRATEFAAQAT